MNENIVLVTGMSGAGKSSAMNALEDLGYYCIDNFPKELLPNLEELLEKKSAKYKSVALSVSAIDYVYFVKYFDNNTNRIQSSFGLQRRRAAFALPFYPPPASDDRLEPGVHAGRRH